LSACTPKLRIPYWRPAEVNLKSITNIAVGGVYGPGSPEIEAELQQAIFDGGRFQLVDSAHTQQVLSELAFQNTGLVDSSQASALGKQFGAAALIFAQTTTYDVQEKLDKNVYKDDKGVSHTTWTRDAWATVETSFQVIDCETGKILAIKKLQAKSHASLSATDEQPGYIDPGPLYTDARAQVVSSFMKVIAPYQDYAVVKLYKDKNVPQLDVGIRYAKTGAWDAAIKEFEAAYAAYPASDKAMYDLGVAYTYTWQFDKALPLLEKAYATSPKGAYEVEIANCKRLWEERKKLESQAPADAPTN
jgi:tetratricopeptide (TPR) repeat protein